MGCKKVKQYSYSIFAKYLSTDVGESKWAAILGTTTPKIQFWELDPSLMWTLQL